MATLVADCPRCGAASITFDVSGKTMVDIDYGWMNVYETFCICRRCHRATIFILADASTSDSEYIQRTNLFSTDASLNSHLNVRTYINLRHNNPIATPSHVPGPIKNCFEEAAACLAIECWNASAAMFRTCIDIATKEMLPDDEVNGLNSRTRRVLAERLNWLFENNYLPSTLFDLSECVRQDGNDGVHQGNLGKADAEDLCDFTAMLLERLYTEPERLRLAAERRANRRNSS